MKGFLAFVLLLLAFGSHAHQEDEPITTGTELRDWCEAESQAWLVGKELSPFNWTASYWEETNLFRVKGSWRVDGKTFTVECRVARGAQRRYATMVMHEPK